jgi:hypothetical protein
MLFSLTPAALGVAELTTISLGKVLHYSASDALLVQGVIRGVAIGTLLIGGPIAFVYLQRRILAANPK